eukprot:SAG31_NODE_103_length_25164_cov_12.124317_16_plen_226_part_00
MCCESCWASGLFLSTQATAPASCNAIRLAGTRENGLYTIDPDGPGGLAPFEVWCDMRTAGGGWALVMNRQDDVPTTLTQRTLEPDQHATAIDDARFLAMKTGTTQILLVNGGRQIYSDGASSELIAEVSDLDQANCRPWSSVDSLLQTPLVWDEDSGCDGRGGDYSEILGHGNENDGGGRDVTSDTHAERHNYFGRHSSLSLYHAADGSGSGGSGEFENVALYLR